MRKNMTRAVAGLGGVGYVGGSSGTAATGDFSVDISSVGHATGDVGILTVVSSTQDNTPTITGWTQLDTAVEGDCNTDVYYRSMVSTDTTVASTTGGSYVEAVATVNIFTGVSTSSPGWVSAQGVVALPNCPQGSVVTGAQAISVAIGTLAGGSWSGQTAPSGYTFGSVDDIATGTQVYNYPAYKVITAQDDPAAHGGTGAQAWVGYTITLQAA